MFVFYIFSILSYFLSMSCPYWNQGVNLVLEKAYLFEESEHLEMANKPVPVGIARIRPRFDGESPHWLGMGMGMGMGNPRLFQLGMGMGMGMYIYPP